MMYKYITIVGCLLIFITSVHAGEDGTLIEGDLRITGTPGVSGLVFPDGSIQYEATVQGPIGPPGLAGANGYNALISTTNESIGANCSNGGTRVQVGLDLNNNSELDAGEVTQTRYVCNGSSATSSQVVDANGITVGYFLFDCWIGMSHDGQNFMSKMQNGVFVEYSLQYENATCSGTPYVQAATENNWNTPIGYVINGNNRKDMYVAVGTDRSVNFYSSYSDGYCRQISGGFISSLTPVSYLFNMQSKYQAPYSIKFGYQP